LTKPRVLLAGHLPPPMGGIGTFCQALLSSSLASETDLAFVQTSSQRRDLLASGIPTWRNLAEALKDGLRFWRVYRAHGPDLVHICTAQGLSLVKNSFYVAAVRASGCPVLLHPHCSLPKLYGHNPLWQAYCRLVFRMSNGVLGLSREWLSLERLVPGLRVFYLPNAIDTHPYREIAAGRPPSRGRRLHLLHLGYLGEAKGTYDLLEAYRALDAGGTDLALHLVGEFLTAEDEGRLRRLAAGLTSPGKACSLEPPVSGEAKLALFRQADIFVFPSHDEGMPMAILEAMAAGLPIAATPVGGVPDLIEDGVNGLLTPPHDPPALAKSLERLIADEGLRLRLGARNLALSGDHDIGRYAKTLMGVYGTLLDHPR
jgi:glycosyltransferase involved in cell wall biosynthesis